MLSIQIGACEFNGEAWKKAFVKMKAVIINPQWQGGANTETYYGAMELKELYLQRCILLNVPVSADENEQVCKKNGILYFDALRRQMKTAKDLLLRQNPDRIFSVGGGCDADVPVISYLNEKYRGNLTILWLDAHGDLNAPCESETSLFYGMPLRAVMDGSCFGLLENNLPVKCSQVIHVGGRDFDDTEKTFIKKMNLRCFSVREFRKTKDLIEHAIQDMGPGKLYIHLDLDVLDKDEFPYTPLPVEGGLFKEELLALLESQKDRLAGLGIYEYKPAGIKLPYVEQLIKIGIDV